MIVGGTGLYIDSLLYGFDFESTKKEPQFDYKFILLNDVRDNLYRKINIRVDKMLNNGLINEVKALRKMGVNLNNQCMQAIGYKEVYAYLDGELEYDEMVSLIKKNTRNYAKRQLTWFRHEKNLEEWVVQDREKLLEHLCQFYIEYKK